MLLGDGGTFGTLTDGNAQMEDAIVVLCREDEVIATVLLYHIVVPHLLLCPGHLVNVKYHAVVGDFGFKGIARKGQHMIVSHLEVTAVVVEGSPCLDVVRRVDIQAVVKHMNRRVGHIIVGEQVALHGMVIDYWL